MVTHVRDAIGVFVRRRVHWFLYGIATLLQLALALRSERRRRREALVICILLEYYCNMMITYCRGWAYLYWLESYR